MYFEEDNNYGLVSIDDGKVKTLSDYNNLKSQLADIKPTSATSSTVTGNSSLACPATGANWKAATELPPTPDKTVCDCIKNSFECVVKDDVDSDEYADLFSFICSDMDCSDITANGTDGKYGPYSFCDAKTKLSYLLNKYYESNGKDESACSFSGSASITSATSAASTCDAVISSASSTGDSSNQTASSSSSKSSSSSSSSSSSTKDSAAVFLKPSSRLSLYMGMVFVVFECGLIMI